MLERDVQRAVIELLQKKGWRVYRTNTMGIWDPTLRKYRKLQGAKGFPDIVAMKRHADILFLEIKKTGGELTKDQDNFRKLFYQTTQKALWLKIDDPDLLDRMLSVINDERVRNVWVE